MNETQESPDMGKAQEKVTFFTTNLNYTIQIIPEKKGFDGEVPFILPARLSSLKVVIFQRMMRKQSG